MKTVIITGSLNPNSNSFHLAEHLRVLWAEKGIEIDQVDLRELELPLCDGSSVYEDPRVQDLQQRLRIYDAFVMAVPIYNFDGNAALKNVIELAGKEFQDKIAGFLCAAGGTMSYMSIMAFANSLMLDYRTVILPRFVYATHDDISDDGVITPAIQDRIEAFGDEFQRLAQAVTSARS